MTTILGRDGFVINHKRVRHLYRDEGLRVVHKPKKRSWVESRRSRLDGIDAY